jgi:hypothetical protein
MIMVDLERANSRVATVELRNVSFASLYPLFISSLLFHTICLAWIFGYHTVSDILFYAHILPFLPITATSPYLKSLRLTLIAPTGSTPWRDRGIAHWQRKQ